MACSWSLRLFSAGEWPDLRGLLESWLHSASGRAGWRGRGVPPGGGRCLALWALLESIKLFQRIKTKKDRSAIRKNDRSFLIVKDRQVEKKKVQRVYKCSILSLKREKTMAVPLLMYLQKVSVQGSTRHQPCWLPWGRERGQGRRPGGLDPLVSFETQIRRMD